MEMFQAAAGVSRPGASAAADASAAGREAGEREAEIERLKAELAALHAKVDKLVK
jgi:uncharacterized protein YceH (UPF0502 family)